MKVGLGGVKAAAYAEPSHAAALAGAAERHGIDSLWTVEHVVVPKGYRSPYAYARDGRMPDVEDVPLADPLTWLAWVAGQTKRVRLATGVLVLPHRSPGILAKELATLDRLSGGRVILGVDAGWLREEFDALRVPFDHRGRCLSDYVRAMRALWREDEPTYEGPFTSIRAAISQPKPIQPSIPVVVGGHSVAAAMRAGRLGDGFFPATTDPDTLGQLIKAMRQAATDVGRDGHVIEITAPAPRRLDDAKLLRDLGVSRLVFPLPTLDVAALDSMLAPIVERFVDHL